MCLVAFAIGTSPDLPLVVASNRDEFFDRPALPLSAWKSETGIDIFSGRDVLAGGTWLGATRRGRVAWLTNVREVNAAPAPRSRGELVMRWLEGDMTAEAFMVGVDCSAYGGFNLVLGDLAEQRWTWLSNRQIVPAASGDMHLAKPSAWQSKTLPPGIYGLSNASLDSPWPKSLALKASLTALLADTHQADDVAAPLWQALASRQQSELTDLPRTGLPDELEKALSSAFIAQAGRGLQGYGTRCSTLLVAKPTDKPDQANAWALTMQERTFQSPRDTATLDNAPGFTASEVSFIASGA